MAQIKTSGMLQEAKLRVLPEANLLVALSLLTTLRQLDFCSQTFCFRVRHQWNIQPLLSMLAWSPKTVCFEIPKICATTI